ncbi:MAG: cytochrome [Fibrobacteres bacterium]|nr:cytochrome [Fibrobacterota bacterium]
MHALLILSCLGLSAYAARAADTILIFTKTAAFREDNIAPTRLALKKHFESKGIIVDTSENAGLFNDTALARYRAVVFLKTSGDVLDSAQQKAFEKYFRSGGGMLGIHSALDTEFDWPFFGKLIGGAWFKGLGGNSETRHSILVQDTADLSAKSLPRTWVRTDEIYNFKANPRDAKDPVAHILVTVDESTYPGGTPGKDHPMSWYIAYQGGRSWVTAMGHTTGSYQDPLFLGHLWGGLQYVLGRTATAVHPEALRMGASAEGRARNRMWSLSGRWSGPWSPALGSGTPLNRLPGKAAGPEP